MNLEIRPYDGVGSFKLGMSQSEIRNVLGCEVRSFMKTPAAEMPADNFVGTGIHVYYKLPGVCKAIEFHPPANPTFRGLGLIDIPCGQLFTYLKCEDPSAEVDDCGLTSRLFGINLYVPDLDEGVQAPVKAVIVFERGYYD